MKCKMCRGRGWINHVTQPCPDCLGSGVKGQIRDTLIPPSPCTNCGRVLDMALSLQGADPREVLADGDQPICVCQECGHLMALNDNLKLRDLTDEEVIGIAGWKDMLVAGKIAGAFREWKKRKMEKDHG